MVTLGNTKCRLLEHLLHAHNVPLSTLVKITGVTENTVRSHLADFKKDRLVEQGPITISPHGHPRYTYSLTIRELILALSEERIGRDLVRVAGAYGDLVPVVLGKWSYFHREDTLDMATRRLYNAVTALRDRDSYLREMDEVALRDQLTTAFYFQEQDLAKWQLGEEHFDLAYWGIVIQGDPALREEVAKIWETMSRFHWVRHRFVGYVGVRLGILDISPSPEIFPPLMEATLKPAFAVALQEAEYQRLKRYGKEYHGSTK